MSAVTVSRPAAATGAALAASRAAAVPEAGSALTGPSVALLAPPLAAAGPLAVPDRFARWDLTAYQRALAVEVADRAARVRARFGGAVSDAEAVVIAAVELGWAPPAGLYLTARELRIVELIGAGLTNRRIGRELGVAQCTVRDAVGRILRRSGLGTRVELVVAALKSGRLAPRAWDGVPPVVDTGSRDLLSMVARGLSNGQIASRLGVSYDVVANRLRRLFALLGARDRAHLVRLAVDAGVLEVGAAGERPGTGFETREGSHA